MPASDYSDGLPRAEHVSLTDDPARLRAEVETLRAQFSGVRPGTPQEGADSSDSVWVVVDAQRKVSDVNISRHWPDKLSLSELGSALLEAYNQALEKVTTLAALAALDGVETASPSIDTTPEPQDVEPDDEAWVEADTDTWLESVWSRIEAAAAEFDEALKLDTDRVESENVVRGPKSYVEVVARGSRVVDVVLDERRIRNGEGTGPISQRGTHAISQDARAAFDAAVKGARR